MDLSDCTPEEYHRSNLRDHITCLTRRDTVGLTVIVEAGLVSLVAILYLFTIILRRVIWRLRHVPRAQLRVFHNPMDILIFSLLCADIVQAIGMIFDLKWIINGKIEEGSFCTSQGFIKSFGATGVALSTAAISIYTFIGVWMAKTITSMTITLCVVFVIWIFDAIVVMLGFVLNNDKTYITPVPYWCWVKPFVWKLVAEYLWLWITLVLSILIYIPLYFWMRGNIDFDETTWWKFRFKRVTNEDPEVVSRRRQSLVMLAYPVVYCICVLMLSVVRWRAFWQDDKYGKDDVPSAATFTGEAIFGLSGLFNVILLLTTRPQTGLFGNLMFQSPTTLPPAEPVQAINADMERLEEADYELGRLPSK